MIIILIPLTVGAIMLPLATGGDATQAWGHAVALLTIIAAIYGIFYALT